MARPIWTGALSFGLVSIPVSLVGAENRKDLAFHMLDGRDMSPIHNRRVSERTGQEVPYEKIVKGYEYEPARHVVVSDEDLREADVKATQTIAIEAFVRADEVDPVYFERPYFVTPARAGAKAYAILREAMSRSGYIGVATVVIRSRQHLAAIVPHDSVLVLELMRWGYELRGAQELELPDLDLDAVGATDKEVALAGQLIDAMVEPFEIDAYRDTYHDDLMSLIRRRIESGEAAATQEAVEEAAAREAAAGGAEEGAEVVDIMSLLKKSVKDAQAKDAQARDARAKGA